jgi:hypothetical protein
LNHPLERALISAVSDCLCFDLMSQCRHDQADQMAEAFPTEAEAENFARSKFGEVDNLTAGTLKPSSSEEMLGGGDS